jgi:hypothetical protein
VRLARRFEDRYAFAVFQIQRAIRDDLLAGVDTIR